MSQKALLNDYKWIKDISQFNEGFIKSYNKKIDEAYFLEVDVKNYKNFIIIYYFYLKE